VSAKWSPCGQYLLVKTSGLLNHVLLDANLRKLCLYQGNAVFFSCNGALLFALDEQNGQLSLCTPGKPMQTPGFQTKRKFAFHPQNDYQAAVWNETGVVLWDIVENSLDVVVMAQSFVNLVRCEWTSTGERLWLYFSNNHLQLWSVTDKQMVREIRLPEENHYFTVLGESAIVSQQLSGVDVFTGTETIHCPEIKFCLCSFKGGPFATNKTFLVDEGRHVVTFPNDAKMLNEWYFELGNEVVDRERNCVWTKPENSVCGSIFNEKYVLLKSSKKIWIAEIATGQIVFSENTSPKDVAVFFK
jgi:hypothetical protein